jgi:UDP-N-acetylmuramate dehydrogenase
VRLSELTTLRVGGPARRVLSPAHSQDLVRAATEVWAAGEPWLAVGGGSNLVVADDGFDGTVLRVLTRGIEGVPARDGRVRLRVQAGESWDGLVAHTVRDGLSGIEALSGIPGSVGAAPVQNIGAYGQEISDSLVAVDLLDAESGLIEHIEAADLALGYRTSVMKYERRGIVLAVELELEARRESVPVAYSQLANTLGVELGATAPLNMVRDAVLTLRRSKGMVLDPTDPDSVSAGSFFTNPIVSAAFASELPERAPRFPLVPEAADVAVPLGSDPAPPAEAHDHRVKLSAAWLIENAGIARGFRLPGSRAAVSSRHTLALVNTGGASADEVLQLARYVQTRVMAEFGVLLAPEPLIVGAVL